MTNPQTNRRQTSYQLLVKSEEKERNVFESVACFLLIAATCAAMWQFSQQPVTFTDLGMATPVTAAQASVLSS